MEKVTESKIFDTKKDIINNKKSYNNSQSQSSFNDLKYNLSINNQDRRRFSESPHKKDNTYIFKLNSETKETYYENKNKKRSPNNNFYLEDSDSEFDCAEEENFDNNIKYYTPNTYIVNSNSLSNKYNNEFLLNHSINSIPKNFTSNYFNNNINLQNMQNTQDDRKTIISKLSNMSLASLTNDKYPSMIFKSGNLKNISNKVDLIISPVKEKYHTKKSIKSRITNNSDSKVESAFILKTKPTNLLVKEVKNSINPYTTYALEEELDNSKIRKNNYNTFSNTTEENLKDKKSSTILSQMNININANIKKNISNNPDNHNNNNKKKVSTIYKNFFDPKNTNHMFNKILTERDHLRKELKMNIPLDKNTQSISYSSAERNYINTLSNTIYNPNNAQNLNMNEIKNNYGTSRSLMRVPNYYSIINSNYNGSSNNNMKLNSINNINGSWKNNFDYKNEISLSSRVRDSLISQNNENENIYLHHMNKLRSENGVIEKNSINTKKPRVSKRIFNMTSSNNTNIVINQKKGVCVSNKINKNENIDDKNTLTIDNKFIKIKEDNYESNIPPNPINYFNSNLVIQNISSNNITIVEASMSNNNSKQTYNKPINGISSINNIKQTVISNSTNNHINSNSRVTGLSKDYKKEIKGKLSSYKSPRSRAVSNNQKNNFSDNYSSNNNQEKEENISCDLKSQLNTEEIAEEVEDNNYQINDQNNNSIIKASNNTLTSFKTATNHFNNKNNNNLDVIKTFSSKSHLKDFARTGTKKVSFKEIYKDNFINKLNNYDKDTNKSANTKSSFINERNKIKSSINYDHLENSKNLAINKLNSNDKFLNTTNSINFGVNNNINTNINLNSFKLGVFSNRESTINSSNLNINKQIMNQVDHSAHHNNVNYNRNNYYNSLNSTLIGLNNKSNLKFKSVLNSNNPTKNNTANLINNNINSSSPTMTNYPCSINNNNNILNTSNQTISNNNLNNLNLNTKSNNNHYFCPHCTHCSVKDKNLISHISSMKEAKNVINKYALFILQSNILDEENQNFLSDEIIKNIKMEDNAPLKEFPFNITINDIKNNSKIIEEKLTLIPKVYTSSKNSRVIVANLLEAILEKKETLGNVLENEIKNKFDKSLIAKGNSFLLQQQVNTNTIEDIFNIEKTTNKTKYTKFNVNNKAKSNSQEQIYSEVIFDEELINMMDEGTISSIKELVRKKIFENEDFKKSQSEIINSKNELKEKFLVLFVMFIQILAEVSAEDKSRAVLLYKFFKHYFIEQDKKWITTIKEMKSRVKYYKTLCKIIIQQKNKHLKHIEEISEVLVANKPSVDNLRKHKELIENLLCIIQEKRDEMYLQNSEINTLKKELNFWIYDFDKIKINTDIREKMASLNKETILYQIDKEIGHKNLKKDIHSLVANADMFLLLSGQRKYFFDQKEYYINETDRVTKLNVKFSKEIERLNQVIRLSKNELEESNLRHQREVEELRKRFSTSFSIKEVQTDLNSYGINTLIKNNENYLNLKKINEPKIMEIYDNVIFNCSQEDPISKISLMRLIPEIFSFKFEGDLLSEYNVMGIKNTLAEYFYKYFKLQFQIKKLANEKMEATVKSIVKYCNEDFRIDLFRRFLNIGPNPISPYVLEKYFCLLKSFPFNFHKLFELTIEEIQETQKREFEDFNNNNNINNKSFEQTNSAYIGIKDTIDKNHAKQKSLNIVSSEAQTNLANYINKSKAVKIKSFQKTEYNNIMFKNNPLLKIPEQEYLISLELVFDILHTRIKIDSFINVLLEDILIKSLMYSKKHIIKKKEEVIEIKINKINPKPNNSSYKSGNDNNKENNTILNDSCNDNYDIALTIDQNREKHKIFNLSSTKKLVGENDIKLNSYFQAFIIDLILNKVELFKENKSNNEILIIEGLNSKYLRSVERVMKWFEVEFQYIITVLQKFFKVENEEIQKQVEIINIFNTKKSLIKESKDKQEEIDSKFDYFENNTFKINKEMNKFHSNFIESVFIKKNTNNNDNNKLGFYNTTNPPISTNTNASINCLTKRFDTGDRLPNNFSFALSKIKVIEFLNLDLSFKLIASDLIILCLNNLENLERIVNDQIEESLYSNKLEAEQAIHFTKIHHVLEHLIDEVHIKAVEDEILKNSKGMNNRDFFTIREFNTIALNSNYFLKLLLRRSSFFKRRQKKIEELIFKVEN